MPIEREMILVPSDHISEKGFDFTGNPIHNDFDYRGYKIVYRKKLYDWGGKNGHELELFSGERFIMIVHVNEIRLLKI